MDELPPPIPEQDDSESEVRPWQTDSESSNIDIPLPSEENSPRKPKENSPEKSAAVISARKTAPQSSTSISECREKSSTNSQSSEDESSKNCNSESATKSTSSLYETPASSISAVDEIPIADEENQTENAKNPSPLIDETPETPASKSPTNTSPIHESSSNSAVEANQSNAADDDDEFGDFGDFTTTTSMTHETSVDWNAFESTSRSNDDDDDEWAAFAAQTSEECLATSSEMHVEMTKVTLPSLSSILAEVSSLDELFESQVDVLETNSPFDETPADSAIVLLDAPLEGMTSDEQMAALSEKGAEFATLHTLFTSVDHSPSLRMSWARAVVRVYLLHLLNMDEQLARACHSHLPAFAAQLVGSTLVPQSVGGGVLRPINVEQSNVRPMSDEMAASDFTSKPSSSTMKPTPITNGASVDYSLQVPPADFNWSSAGLDNPLTAKHVSDNATMMELDFLEKNLSPPTPIVSVDTRPTMKPPTITKQQQRRQTQMTAVSEGVLTQDLAQLDLIQAQLERRKLEKQRPSGLPVKKAEAKKPSLVKPPSTRNAQVQPISDSSPVLQPMSAHPPSTAAVLAPSQLSESARPIHDKMDSLDFMLANELQFPTGN